MGTFNQPEIQRLTALDDSQLEAVRIQVLDFDDDRIEQVIRLLVMRALPILEWVARSRGTDRGLGRAEVVAAIEDATARLLIALSRDEHQRPIRAMAAGLAAECVDAQVPRPPQPPRLAPRTPELRLLSGLGDALEGQEIKRNDWRHS